MYDAFYADGMHAKTSLDCKGVALLAALSNEVRSDSTASFRGVTASLLDFEQDPPVMRVTPDCEPTADFVSVHFVI